MDVWGPWGVWSKKKKELILAISSGIDSVLWTGVKTGADAKRKEKCLQALLFVFCKPVQDVYSVVVI